MSDDPWKHRSEGMKCRTCMWCIMKTDTSVGRCRRHAPTMSGYPVVFPDDWCGDHKLDETKFGPSEQEKERAAMLERMGRVQLEALHGMHTEEEKD